MGFTGCHRHDAVTNQYPFQFIQGALVSGFESIPDIALAPRLRVGCDLDLHHGSKVLLLHGAAYQLNQHNSLASRCKSCHTYAYTAGLRSR